MGCYHISIKFIGKEFSEKRIGGINLTPSLLLQTGHQVTNIIEYFLFAILVGIQTRDPDHNLDVRMTL